MAAKRTSKHIIAYFDILGYKDILKRNLIPESELIQHIDQITNTVLNAKNPMFGGQRGKVHCFSDNFAISVKVRIDKEIILILEALVLIMQKLQGKLLAEFGLFIRGSIVQGNLYVNRNFIFGEGLIKAYEIENELAIYPRIVVEYNLVKEVVKYVESYFEYIDEQPPEIINEQNYNYLFREFLFRNKSDNNEEENEKYNFQTIRIRKDEDNEYFVDFLQELLTLAREGDSISRINTDSKDEMDRWSEFYLFLWAYCREIFSALIINSENKHVLIKYLWCCSYINSFCAVNGIEPPFTFHSIQDTANINLKNAKYKELSSYLRIPSIKQP